jgi:hypothetical protein
MTVVQGLLAETAWEPGMFTLMVTSAKTKTGETATATTHKTNNIFSRNFIN